MWTWRSLAKTSVRPPSIVIIDVLIDCSLQVLVAKNQPVIQAFIADAPDPTLCDCIGLWCFHWSADLSDTERSGSAIE